jgi:hypothetical protein
MTKPEEPARERLEDELIGAQELLERTVEFLSLCIEDRQAAFDSDDPRELIRGLKALARDRALPEIETRKAGEDSPPIQIHRRRSA